MYINVIISILIFPDGKTPAEPVEWLSLVHLNYMYYILSNTMGMHIALSQLWPMLIVVVRIVRLSEGPSSSA